MARIPGTKKKEEEKTSSIFNVPPRLPAPAPTPEPAPVPGGEERSDEPIKTGQELLGESEVGKKDVELLGKGGIRIRGQDFFGPGLAPEFQQAAAREISGADPSVQQQRQGELTEATIGEQERAAGKLEEFGVFEDRPLGGVDIDPVTRVLEDPNILPFIGPVGEATSQALDMFAQDEDLNAFTYMNPEQKAETVRQQMIVQIKEDVWRKGLNNAELVGSKLEAMPVIKGEAQKWLGVDLNLPSDNARTIISTMKSMEQDYSDIGSKTANGELSDPLESLKLIQEMDFQVAEYEARLKLLTSVSPELQTDTDLVDQMKRDILRVKQRSFDSKQQAARALIERPIPTDAQLYLSLRELKLNR